MKPTSSLPPRVLGPVLASLRRANAAEARRYPGDPSGRQPLHTVYGGAHLFRPDTARRLGELALAALWRHAPDAASLAGALGLPAGLAGTVYERVRGKLRDEPVEDYRLDFEDGYGNRPDAEEDGHAVSAAEAVAEGLAAGTLPPFIGIRVKPFTAELAARSARTLDLFLTALVRKTKGRLPSPFYVTLPKITHAAQAAALGRLLGAFEKAKRLPRRAVSVELMVEAPQLVVGAEGAGRLRACVDALEGRCTGAHFGTYDYTASCGVTAAEQRMDHPSCDFAKIAMQAALAGSGVALSDGAVNVMPVGPHRAPAGGALAPEQERENDEAVRRVWRGHYEQVRRSMAGGFYQGWDLHPAQLPTRYAAAYAFFLEGLPQATARLRNFVDKAAQATLVGDVFDDAATGQGLLNYFLRARACGAVTEEEARACGLTPEELAGRSFLKILEGRRKLR